VPQPLLQPVPQELPQESPQPQSQANRREKNPRQRSPKLRRPQPLSQPQALPQLLPQLPHALLQQVAAGGSQATQRALRTHTSYSLQTGTRLQQVVGHISVTV
jgi:hypothetical protein